MKAEDFLSQIDPTQEVSAVELQKPPNAEEFLAQRDKSVGVGISAEDFLSQNIQEQAQDINIQDREPTFSEKYPSMWAAGKAVADIPRGVAEFGESVVSGATLGLSEKVGELGEKLAEKITGVDLQDEKKEKVIRPWLEVSGEMAGAAAPIGAISKTVAAPLIRKLAGSKEIKAFHKIIGGAATGSTYTAAENLIKEGELPSPKEVAEQGAIWGAVDGALHTAGLTKRFASAVNKLSKINKTTKKEALGTIIKEAKATDKSIVKHAEGLVSAAEKKIENIIPKVERPLIKLDRKTDQKTFKNISSTTDEIIKSSKVQDWSKKGVTAAKESMIAHDRNIRSAEFVSKQFTKAVKDIVPDQGRQMLMVHAYENKMKGKYWEQLDANEKNIVKWASAEKAKLNKYIKENNVFETMPESEKINHIFHHWVNPKTGEPYSAMYSKFSKGLPQAKQRTIPTYEAGIEKGLQPATTNIGELIGLEWESVTRANNARQLFKELHGIKGDVEVSIKLGKKDQPIHMIERWDKLQKQGLTEGYTRYDNPFLDKAIVFKNKSGKDVILKGAVGVREELYPFVRSYIENPTYGKLSELNFASKSLKLGASLFHPVSLGMQELANLRVPFVNIPKGLKLGKELGPRVKLLHKEGLELFKGYEDLGYRNKFFDDATKLGKLGNMATWPINKMRDFIFDYVQPGMKISFADMQLQKMLPKYLEKAGIKQTPEEIMALVEAGKPVPEAALKAARDVVKKADGHFSGEHAKRALLETNRFMVKLYFTPEARKFWQTALLSPTWQREHLLVAKNVAKSFMPDKMIKKLNLSEMGPIKSQYRRYALGGVMIIGAVDLWNQMSTKVMDGERKHLWENPSGKRFSVRAWWDEPDYTVTDKNGTRRRIKGGPAYIRPLKSLFEVAEWGKDPFKKAAYKLSPLVTAIGGQLFENRGYKGLPDVPQRAKDFILETTTPIVADQFTEVAKGHKRPESAILPFVGMPTSKEKKQGIKKLTNK
jgi:hypothetical protein